MLHHVSFYDNVRGNFKGHPLRTDVKISEKLTFLTTWYALVRVRIIGLEILVFRKILRTYLTDDPLHKKPWLLTGNVTNKVKRLISVFGPT